MRIPGRGLLRRGFARARARYVGGAAVLGYHRVGTDDPHEISVSAEVLAEHLQVIARRARPLPLLDAARALQERSLPRRAVVVTFDDGYADTLSAVLPLVERYRVPVTVFVTTGNPGSPFWWDDLSHVVLSARNLREPLELQLDGRIQRFEAGDTLPDSPARRMLLGRLADALRSMQRLQRESALQQVREWAGNPPGVPRHRGLNHDEIRRLAECPLVDIGAHTVTHPVLPLLHVAEQQWEVEESRATLERLTGRRVRSFSYPNGAYSAESRAVVAAAGFSAACCSSPGVAARSDDPLLLPRLWAGNRPELEFADWLRRWTGD
jgi:peptidoglycan/xylan/chitin deacetylase (PgdA/CDA1 family)